MAKNLRFTELVKKSGQPVTVTLWTRPEANSDLQKAIRQNRVLTIIKNPQKKDFGLIGFEQHQSALYLVFPKPLPKTQPDLEVIGIKYDLLEESKLFSNSPASPSKPAKKSLKPKPVPKIVRAEKLQLSQPRRKKFLVTIARAATLETQVAVTALNMAEAETLALEKVKRQKISPHYVRDEVKAIAEKNNF